jgi:hypothetical protein
MAAVPEGYPFRLDDDELEETLDGMMDPSSWPGFDNFSRLLPELKTALLLAGLQEHSRRETAELRLLTQEASESTIRMAKRSLAVAYAALVVALVTSVASIVIAFVN